MTVDRVSPCVSCSKDSPGNEIFPHLGVRNGLGEHRQFWTVFCPQCGCGSHLLEFKSAYLALKQWNEWQAIARDVESILE